MQIKTTAFLALAVSSLVAVSPMWADDPLIGRRVYPKTNFVPIQIGNSVIGTPRDIIYPVKVEDVQGEWLQIWLGHRVLNSGWIQRGNVCVGDEAIPYFTTLLSQNPWDQHALHMRSLAYVEAKRFDEAIQDARDLAARWPSAAHYSMLGSRLSSVGRPDEALAAYDQSLAYDPRYFWARHNRAEILIERNDWDRALIEANTCIAYHPRHASAFKLRSRVARHFGDLQGAAADLEQARSISPNNEWLANQLAWLRATCPDATVRNGAEAVTLAKSACEKTKWKKSVYIETLAAAYAETGQFDEASKMLQLAQDLNSTLSANRRDKMKADFENRVAYRESTFEPLSAAPVPDPVP